MCEAVAATIMMLGRTDNRVVAILTFPASAVVFLCYPTAPEVLVKGKDSRV
jgi:hypothetical protein